MPNAGSTPPSAEGQTPPDSGPVAWGQGAGHSEDSGAGRGGRGAQPRAQRLPGAQSSSLALSSPEPSARRLPESHVCTCGKRPARGLSVLAPWDSAGPRGLQRLPGPCPCPLRAELSFKSLPTSSPRPHPRWAGRLQESRLGTPETD